MSSSLSSVRESLAKKIGDWIGPLRHEYRDRFKDDCSIEKLRERFPKADEKNLKIQSEKITRQFIEENSSQLRLIESVADEVLQALDKNPPFFYFFFQPSNHGVPNENIPTIDIFEEFGEVQRISYEAYCKTYENVEEQEDPEYCLARIQLMQREVPESIVHLKYLREFVQEKLLDRLPRNFGQLHNLRRIDIGEYTCDLAELPEDLGTFPHLKVLRIVNTQIKRIPPSLFENTSIEEMILERNQIEEIDSRIGNLCNLKELNIRDNKITSLPTTMGILENLKVLRGGHNLIETLPISLDKLKLLTTASFANNRIFYLPMFTQLALLRKNAYLNNPIYEELSKESQEKEASTSMSKLDLKGHK